MYFIPMFLIVCVPLLAGINSELKESEIMFVMFYMLLVAFAEEVLYRGIILNSLRKISERFGVIGSAVMFGASHLITATSGKSLFDVGFQVVMAFVIGLILALIVMRTNNIYIGIAYHYINNVVVSIGASFGVADTIVSYLLLLALVIYLFILKSKLQVKRECYP